MPGNGSRSKLKILYLLRIFQEETDAEHGLTMPQIIDRLADYGISAERKSVYSDIAALREFDVDIRTYERHPVEYALARPDFSLGELMLMVDAIESCRAITDRQAQLLVCNIKTLANNFEQEKLDRRIHVVGRIKSRNESVFGSIDTIHEAMRLRRRITYSYFRRMPDGSLTPTHEGLPYEVTPLDVVYDGGFYYLTAWDPGRGRIAEFRVDRIGGARVTDVPADSNEAIRTYRYEESSYESFGRFKGEKFVAALAVRSDKTEIITDRFGQAVRFEPRGDGTVLARVKVYKSDQFFGWVAGMGTMVDIVGPDRLVREWRAFLGKLLKRSETVVP
ncbi:MAG: WYL domain-containing protein [Olsenella sp.]|jgi:predicted DNA-binding transcriptional regulator YafY